MILLCVFVFDCDFRFSRSPFWGRSGPNDSHYLWATKSRGFCLWLRTWTNLCFSFVLFPVFPIFLFSYLISRLCCFYANLHLIIRPRLISCICLSGFVVGFYGFWFLISYFMERGVCPVGHATNSGKSWHGALDSDVTVKFIANCSADWQAWIGTHGYGVRVRQGKKRRFFAKTEK